MNARTVLTTPHCQVELQGRLDLVSAQQLRHLLLGACDQGARFFSVQVTDVEFMDSSGLSALVAGLKRARQQGGDLVLVHPSAAVAKLLELTLLSQVIPVARNMDEARLLVTP